MWIYKRQYRNATEPEIEALIASGKLCESDLIRTDNGVFDCDGDRPRVPNGALVGFYTPQGDFVLDDICSDVETAAARVHYLNGGNNIAAKDALLVMNVGNG